VTNNVVVIKEEPIEEGTDQEEVPAYSIDVSPEEAADAQVKLEEVMFDWPSNENADEDGRISCLINSCYVRSDEQERKKWVCFVGVKFLCISFVLVQQFSVTDW